MSLFIPIKHDFNYDMWHLTWQSIIKYLLVVKVCKSGCLVCHHNWFQHSASWYRLHTGGCNPNFPFLPWWCLHPEHKRFRNFRDLENSTNVGLNKQRHDTNLILDTCLGNMEKLGSVLDELLICGFCFDLYNRNCTILTCIVIIKTVIAISS